MRRVDLVAGTIEEAGVDEKHPGFHRADTLHEIDGRSPFLVHEADLERVARQTEHVLDRGEKVVGELDLIRSVHLRLDDVDRAGPAVAELTPAFEIMERDQTGDRRIENAFGSGLAVAVEHAFVHHQMADVANEHQAAARQHQRAAIGLRIVAVRGEPTGKGLAVLLKSLDQRSLAQTEPVAIGRHLVLRIDRGDRVLQIHDGRERRFEHDIGNAGGIVAADRMRAVDDNLDMQAVVDQQNGFGCVRTAAIAAELLGVRQVRPSCRLCRQQRASRR